MTLIKKFQLLMLLQGMVRIYMFVDSLFIKVGILVVCNLLKFFVITNFKLNIQFKSIVNNPI